MITIKTPQQIEKMRLAGSIVAQTLELAARSVRPGMTTAQLDKLVEENILAAGASPAFKGYRGYPASACISIDDEVVHGIPGSRKLQEGELVSIDVGVVYDGWYGDSALTVGVGAISPEKQRLLDVTRSALAEAISKVKAGAKLGEIGAAVQRYAEKHGFSVVRDLVGHGIGQAMHEEPQVPNYGSPEEGPILKVGMTLAIEPMINAGGYQVRTKMDGWTIVTADNTPSAHFEHTVAVTKTGADVLTLTNVSRPIAANMKE